MTHKISYTRIVIILLFAIAFTLAGWIAPVAYASYAPQSFIIESHSFTAENATLSSDSHTMEFERTVHRPSSAKTYTELYLLNEEGERVEIDSSVNEKYYSEGRALVIRSIDLPENLVEGKYKYVLVAKFSMADGRVHRDFVFESEPFFVTDDS